MHRAGKFAKTAISTHAPRTGSDADRAHVRQTNS